MDHIEEVWFCTETRQYAVFRWPVDRANEHVGPVEMIEAGSVRQAGDVWLFKDSGKVVCVGFRKSGKPMSAHKPNADQTFATKAQFDAACRWLYCSVERFAASELEAA